MLLQFRDWRFQKLTHSLYELSALTERDFSKELRMSNYENFYLERKPTPPPQSYAYYTPTQQSPRSLPRRPEELCSWDSFGVVCSGYQPNTEQQLEMAPAHWNPAMLELTPEVEVWTATNTEFYSPLNSLSLVLDDDTERLFWKNGKSARSDCDAYLQLAGTGVIAAGRML